MSGYMSGDISQAVDNYLTTTPNGKKILAQVYGVAIDDFGMKIAEELKKKIIDGFLAGTSHVDAGLASAYFDSVCVEAEKSLDGRATIKIKFPQKSLFRPSLYSIGGTHGIKKKPTRAQINNGLNYGFTGTGVNDIFALITNGINGTTKKVFGMWGYVSGSDFEEVSEPIASLNRRNGNPIIKNIIDKFQRNYPFIEIRYPKEWGGNE